MPRNLPQFTRCAPPGNAFPMLEAGSIAMLALVSLVGGGIIAGAALTVLSAIAGEVASAGCVVGAGVAGFFIVGLLDFKDWYYNHRLMCIRHDECSCGTLVGQPHDSTDGDRKIDLLIAPFNVPETEQLQIEALVDLGAAGTLPDVPDAIDLQNRTVRFGYMRGRSQAEQTLVQIDMVDNRMFSQPGRGYLRHLWRRDEAVIGTAAFTNSPDDTLAAASPNPVFRVNPQEGDDPEEGQLVPYMHNELEGDRMARILDNIIVGLLAFLAAFLALCILCELAVLDPTGLLCGPVGAALALLFALLIWLLSNLINDPDDGTAGGVDADVDDPEVDTPPTTMGRGDAVFLFGDWIMDEEHGKYFEIHPIKAYYLLCQGAFTPDDWVLTEEVPAGDCNFDIRDLSADEFDRICRIVKAVETSDPDDTITIPITMALAVAPPR
jgi:hypothetical protein